MYAHELFENPKPRVIVTYPGRFQPFHQGHAGVFAQLQKQFGNENVFIATSNDTSSAKSPFNFSDKYQLMTAAGVPGNHIFETNAMYVLPNDFNPATTVFITAVGAPDADRLNPDSYLKRDKKDKEGNIIKPAGSPGYYKTFNPKEAPLTADQHGYVVVIPEIHKNIKINGQEYNVSHGTDCRNLWNAIRGDDKARSEFLKQLYGRADKHLAAIFDKIPAPTQEDIDQRATDTISPIHGGVKKGTAGLVPIEESAGHEYILYVNNKPAAKYVDLSSAEQDILKIKHKVPNAKFEVKKEVCNMVAVPSNIAEALKEFAPGNGDDGDHYAEYVVYQCDPNDEFEFIGDPLYQSDSLGMAHKYAYEMFLKHRPRAFVIYQPHKEASRGHYGVKDERGIVEELREFADDDFDDRPKFIPWHDFIEGVKGIVGKDFDVVEKVIKSTIQDRFMPIDPMEFGPTMLYSYYEARAGRNKGAISTRGSIQVGKYYPNTSQLGTRNYITSFNLLKGHPFERHFDLTPENISKIANIILGNTEGAYQMQQPVSEGETQYQVVCDGTKKGIFADKEQAIANAKSMFKHEKEYYHIAVVDLSNHNEVWHWTKKDIAEGFNSKQEVIDHFVRQGKPAAAGAAAWERGWRGPKAKTPTTQAPKSPATQQKYWWQEKDLDEASFDKEAFRRQMRDLEAREELRKTDPVAAKALDLRGKLPQKSKKKPEDDSMSINDPRHPGAAYTQGNQHNEDAAGVGVVATNKKMAKDPRYSMSITKDVKPSTPKNQLRAFRLSEAWTNKYLNENINPEDFHVENTDKLDVILSYLCKMVIEGQKTNKDLFGMVAACVLDTDNRAVFGINYFNDATDNRVHAERCALDQYRAQYGEPPAGSIILTTLSPCCHPMEERYGESCTELINDTDIHKVYCGYKDPTQEDSMNRTFHIKQTRNAGIIDLCKSFADTFLKENFADGRHPEDKGDSKRYGVPTKASVSTLRKVAKQGGRKGQLAHWMANMKAGKQKANENIDATADTGTPDFPAILAKFLPIAMKDLGIDKLPKISLEKHLETHDGQATFGRFINDTNEIELAIADRHPIDILRTLAHELTHFRQHIRNELEHDSGETGSPEENEAHIMAGIIMRHFDKAYPDLLKLNPLDMS